jgi:hypothetical protein
MNSYYFNRPIHDLYALEVFLIKNGFTEINGITTNGDNIKIDYNTSLTEELQNELLDLVLNVFTNPPLLNIHEESFISLLNSSESPMYAFMSFTGIFEEVVMYANASLIVSSNVDSAYDGLIVEYSTDGINVDYRETFTVSGKFYKIISLPTKFLRVRYINGPYNQSSFRLQILYKKHSLNNTSPIQIKEESPNGPPTNGNFRNQTFNIIVNESSSGIKNFCWLYPITALLIKYNTREEHLYDNFNVYIIPTQSVARINYEITEPVNHFIINTTGSISVGNRMYITDSKNTENLGKIVSIDTQGNSITTSNSISATYLKNAHLLNQFHIGVITSPVNIGDNLLTVNSGFLDYAKLGYHVEINNGSTMESLKEILEINKNNNTILVEESIKSTNYGAFSYLYLKVNNIKNHIINTFNEESQIGGSKIGGSYLKPFTIVQLEYKNNSNTQKNFIWNVEYLY